MNKLDLAKTRNLNSLKLKHSSKIHRNCLRTGRGESESHALMKYWICRVLLSMKKEFVCEAVFENCSRADVYVLDDDIAIEVLISEKEKSILLKENKYPCVITTVSVDDCIDMKGVFKLLEDLLV